MSGYSMVARTAQREGWIETAEVRDGVTWVTFSKEQHGIACEVDVELDRSQAGPMVQEPRNSVVSAVIYEDGERAADVAGSGKVQQLQAYLTTGELP